MNIGVISAAAAAAAAAGRVGQLLTKWKSNVHQLPPSCIEHCHSDRDDEHSTDICGGDIFKI